MNDKIYENLRMKFLAGFQENFNSKEIQNGCVIFTNFNKEHGKYNQEAITILNNLNVAYSKVNIFFFVKDVILMNQCILAW